MIIIDTVNPSSNWSFIMGMRFVKRRLTLPIIGWVLTKEALKSLPSKNVRYVRVNPNYEDERLGAYLCGLLSTLYDREVDMVVGDNPSKYTFIPASKYPTPYAVGKVGDLFGNDGVDGYLWYLRRRVYKVFRENRNI